MAYLCDCMDLMLLDASVMDKDAVCNLWKAPAEEIQHRFLQLWIKAQPSASENCSLFKKHNTTQHNPELFLKRIIYIICKGEVRCNDLFFILEGIYNMLEQLESSKLKQDSEFSR